MNEKYPAMLTAGGLVAAGIAATIAVTGTSALVGIGLGLFLFLAFSAVLIAA